MAYAEKVPSPRGAYWRGRYNAGGKSYLSVCDSAGRVIRYKTKRDAKKGADDAESDVRNRRQPPPRSGQAVTVLQWANTWYAGLSLSLTTMRTYKGSLQGHILPRFEGTLMTAEDLLPADIDAWENELHASGLKPSTVRGHRRVLHTMLGDAVPALLPSNPASRRRGRGRRSGKEEPVPFARGRDDEEGLEDDDELDRARVITDAFGALLIAERAAVMTGRDDEFVIVTLLFYTGLRIGELIGLEARRLRLGTLEVRWQLGEVDGKVYRCPPKDDSKRDLVLPPFLAALLSGHVAATAPQPCECHGRAYVFRGHGSKPGRRGPGTREVAQAARVTQATVYRVMRGDPSVSEDRRRRVTEAAAAAGYCHGVPAEPAEHWRRSKLAELIGSAASGMLPARRIRGKEMPRRPVPLRSGEAGETRALGPAAARADACWLPVADGLTPHGLRHSHKSHMVQGRIPEVASEARLGHKLPGLIGLYSQVTPEMEQELRDVMQSAWERSLDERLAVSPRSPVPVLDALLRHRAAAKRSLVPRDSPERAANVADLHTARRVSADR